MKTLQNDLTTIEQSKRLLELGVPKNSANHYYGKDGKLHYIDGTIPYSLLWATGCTPCWSAGRLIEIIGICHQPTPTEMRIATSNTIEYLLDVFDTIADGSGFDFSKLED